MVSVPIPLILSKDRLVDMGFEAEEAEANIETLANPEALAHFRDRQELTG